MSGTKISAGADPGTLVATDKLPLARSASTTAYAATMAEVATYANGAYVPPYYTGTPAMDGTGAPGTATFVSRGDHVHPSDVSRAPLASPTFTGVPAAPTPTTGTNTTQLATTAFVQSQMVASGAGVSTWNTRAGAVVLQQADIVAVGALHDVGRNLLHNPLFNVAQRGTGPWTTSVYTVDRWKLNVLTDTVSLATYPMLDADRAAIGDEAAAVFMQNIFTGNAAAGAYNFIVQNIEGVRRLAGKTITIGLWAKASSGTPKLGVNITQSFGTGGSASAFAWSTGSAITLSTTWNRYTTTIAVPSTAGKTLGTNNDDSTLLSFWFSSGASSNAIAGTIGVQSGTIQLWGVQLEVGSVATPLEKPDPRYDLSNCQRFYVGLTTLASFNGWAGGANQYLSWPVTLPVTMRATPTIILTPGSGANYTSVSVTPGATVFTVQLQSAATGVTFWGGQYTASADL